MQGLLFPPLLFPTTSTSPLIYTEVVLFSLLTPPWVSVPAPACRPHPRALLQLPSPCSTLHLSLPDSVTPLGRKPLQMHPLQSQCTKFKGQKLLPLQARVSGEGSAGHKTMTLRFDFFQPFESVLLLLFKPCASAYRAEGLSTSKGLHSQAASSPQSCFVQSAQEVLI